MQFGQREKSILRGHIQSQGGPEEVKRLDREALIEIAVAATDERTKGQSSDGEWLQVFGHFTGKLGELKG